MVGGDYDGHLDNLRPPERGAAITSRRHATELDHAQNRNRSSKAGWIYVLVSLVVVLPLLTGALIAFAWLNSGNSDVNPSSAAPMDQRGQYLSATVAPYVEPIAGGPNVKLHEGFNEHNGWPSEGRVISQAGYPIMIVLKEAPACESPYRVKEALDAMRSANGRWLDAMSGCELIGKNVAAEWISNPYKGLDTTAMRLTLADGSRKTLYAPSNNPDVGIEAWFGNRYR